MAASGGTVGVVPCERGDALRPENARSLDPAPFGWCCRRLTVIVVCGRSNFAEPLRQLNGPEIKARFSGQEFMAAMSWGAVLKHRSGRFGAEPDCEHPSPVRLVHDRVKH